MASSGEGWVRDAGLALVASKEKIDRRKNGVVE
jgi:hypothetical protein